MRGRWMLYIDQYGLKIGAKTVAELRSKVDGGGCRVSKMYVDSKAGGAFHVGYVIGRHWFNAYIPMERAA